MPSPYLAVRLEKGGGHHQGPAAALGAVLRTLGVADQHIPARLDERAALYRSVLDGRRMLVVIDYPRSPAQVRWMLPAAAGRAVLVTSRRRMIDLAGAHLVELDVLSPGEALHLFTRIADEPEAARIVMAACGSVPLAIRIAACRLAARPTWRIRR
ncbi:hypothetical protein HMPREF1211_02684 [Streptomyces sp. HGB0020]|nr:hypothetical protein HMPREF1211_02684 [Streptomyces sp. HGB0020]